jgi:peptidoglycan hydrolase-like protein with peptidoglycan-binding domain
MRLQKATRLVLALFVAVTPGVSAASAQSQGTAPASSTASKSGTSAHHTRKTSKKSKRRERGQKAPTPERISEIQFALAKDGSYGGKPNGKWDDSTVDAMKKFQESHGLNPSGKLDAKTLQRLGLGSQTAGAAAPQPPVSSSAVTNKPAQTTNRQP